MNSAELDRLERRARSAVSGYTADVNITCYVYGQDVLLLVGRVRELLERCQELSAKLDKLNLPGREEDLEEVTAAREPEKSSSRQAPRKR